MTQDEYSDQSIHHSRRGDSQAVTRTYADRLLVCRVPRTRNPRGKSEQCTKSLQTSNSTGNQPEVQTALSDIRAECTRMIAKIDAAPISENHRQFWADTPLAIGSRLLRKKHRPGPLAPGRCFFTAGRRSCVLPLCPSSTNRPRAQQHAPIPPAHPSTCAKSASVSTSLPPHTPPRETVELRNHLRRWRAAILQPRRLVERKAAALRPGASARPARLQCA